MSEITGDEAVPVPLVTQVQPEPTPLGRTPLVTPTSIAEERNESLTNALVETFAAPAVDGGDGKPEADFFDSYSTTFQEFSTFAAVGQAVLQDSPTEDFDYAYLQGRDEIFKEDEEAHSALKEMREVQTQDPGANRILEKFEEAGSEAEARYWLARWPRLQTLRKEAEAAGGWGMVLGALSGLGLDVGVILATTPLTGGGAAVAGGSSVLRTLMGLGARGALAGAFEGAVDSWARDEIDDSFTVEQALFNVGISAGLAGSFSGILGAGMQRRINRQMAEDIADRELRQIAEDKAVLTGSKSLSAAEVTPETSPLTVSTPTKGSGTSAPVRAVVDRRGVRWLRSPKQIYNDLRARFAKLGGVGDKRAALFGENHHRLNEQTAETRQGISRDLPTDEEKLSALKMEQRVLREEIRDVHKDLLNKTYGKLGVLERLTRKRVTHQELTNYADQYAVARDNVTKNDTRIAKLEAKIQNNPKLSKKYLNRLKAQKQAAIQGQQEVISGIKQRAVDEGFDPDVFESAIVREADMTSDWYEKIGKRAQDQGLIKGDAVRRDYRPQIWNTDAVDLYPTELERVLTVHFMDDVPEEFIETFTKDLTDEAGAPLGKTLDDLMDTNPELVDRIIDEWTEAGLDLISENHQKKLREADWKFSNKFEETVDIIETRAQERMMFHQQRADEQIDKLLELKDNRGFMTAEQFDEAANPIMVKIGRAERARDLWRMKADDITQMRSDLLQSENILKKHGRILTGTERRSYKRARSQFNKAEHKLGHQQTKATAQAMIRERVSEAISKMRDRTALNPFEPDDVMQGSNRFQERGIDLSGIHHKPEIQKFLHRDGDAVLQNYTQTVGSRTILHEQWAPHMRAEGWDGKGDLGSAVTRWVERGYQDDMANLSGKQLEAMKVEKDRATYLVTRSLEEFTNADRAKTLRSTSGAVTDAVTSVVNAGLSMVLLQRSVLASLGDTSTFISGSGRALDPISAAFKTGVGGIGKSALRDNDKLLWVAVRGQQALDQAELGYRYDPDITPAYPGGGMLRRVQLKADKANAAVQWANLSTPQNLFAAKMAGGTAADLILKDAKKGKVSNAVRRAYAEAGLSMDDLKVFKVLTKSGGEIKDGFWTMPNTTKWTGKMVHLDDNGVARILDEGADIPLDGKVIDGDIARSQYLRGVNNLRDNMKMDPAIGDRPFWMRDQVGRLISQFQSFTYAAQNRYVYPMLQEGLINPLQARLMVSAFGMLYLSHLNITARDALDGRDSPESRLYEGNMRDGDMWLLVQHAIRRSPLMIGYSTQMLEAIHMTYGKALNDATGAQVFSHDSLKYRHSQGVSGALTGPVTGTINRAQSIARRAAEGQHEEAMIGASKMLMPFYLSAAFKHYMENN